MALQTPQPSAAAPDLLLPAVGDKRLLLSCGMNGESLDPPSAEAVGEEQEQEAAEAGKTGKEGEKLPPRVAESSTASGLFSCYRKMQVAIWRKQQQEISSINHPN
uniref:Uncharacterized protein n=1 Tax=Sphaerodactylus townsendi TaxID=933632 RepID=A0ACB8F8Z2_9SAUR